MRKLKYVNQFEITMRGKVLLTNGKVYNMIGYIHRTDSKFDMITVIDDNGESFDWFLSSFTDVTAEYRNETIDEILK